MRRKDQHCSFGTIGHAASSSRQPPPSSPRSVRTLAVVQFYYYGGADGDDVLCETIEAWALKHCGDFEEGGEHSLHHTELHHQFCDMFESLIESFVRSEGYSLKRLLLLPAS